MYHGPLLNSFLSFNGPLCGPDYETPPLMDTRAIIHWLSYFWPLMVPLIYVDHSSNGQSVQKPLLLGTNFFFFFCWHWFLYVPCTRGWYWYPRWRAILGMWYTSFLCYTLTGNEKIGGTDLRPNSAKNLSKMVFTIWKYTYNFSNNGLSNGTC